MIEFLDLRMLSGDSRYVDEKSANLNPCNAQYTREGYTLLKGILKPRLIAKVAPTEEMLKLMDERKLILLKNKADRASAKHKMSKTLDQKNKNQKQAARNKRLQVKKPGHGERLTEPSTSHDSQKTKGRTPPSPKAKGNWRKKGGPSGKRRS